MTPTLVHVLVDPMMSPLLMRMKVARSFTAVVHTPNCLSLFRKFARVHMGMEHTSSALHLGRLVAHDLFVVIENVHVCITNMHTIAGP